MAYTVFARKYRPQTFDELVGQEHVARTLANAITTDRVAHAFLFTGVRGVGKTTTARLLAKALNCEQGPTPTPDNTCGICREITAGVDLDVLEMDGASNNSVEDVRRLQESIPYRPTRDRYKVIIVDEVHMLSAAAFNAFLKTLEEPPPHVKFVFATTEAHKVPVTIRSRCQRYDFRLIPNDVVAGRVAEILEKEAIETDEAALALVAREAAGSMRDALTLLDQLVAAAGEQLRGKEVAEVLGIADRAAVTETIAELVGGDGAGVLRAVAGVASRGLDLVHFARQLLELARDLVVLQVAGASDGLVGLLGEERVAMERLVAEADPLELQRVFAGLAPLVDEVAQTGSPKVVLEMGLVRLATRPALRPLGELLGRLEALERRLGGAGGGSGGPGGASRSRSAPPRRSPGRSAPPAAAPPSARGESPRREPPRASPAPAPASGGVPPAGTTSPTPASGGPTPPGSDPAPASDVAAEAGVAPTAAPASAAPAPAPASDAVAPGLTGARMARWERIVDRVRESHPALGAVLERGEPVQVEPEAITIAFHKGSFFGHQADNRDAREALAQAAAGVLGQEPSVRVTWSAPSGRSAAAGTPSDGRHPRPGTPPPPVAHGGPRSRANHASSGAPAPDTQEAEPAGEARTVAELEARRRREREEAARQKALAHPAVQAAMRVFPEAAERVEVRLDLD
jgi:DNA polymerase-3 subunit gamma/tau